MSECVLGWLWWGWPYTLGVGVVGWPYTLGVGVVGATVYSLYTHLRTVHSPTVHSVHTLAYCKHAYCTLAYCKHAYCTLAYCMLTYCTLTHYRYTDSLKPLLKMYLTSLVRGHLRRSERFVLIWRAYCILLEWWCSSAISDHATLMTTRWNPSGVFLSYRKVRKKTVAT